MSFKDIPFLELWRHFLGGAEPFVQVWWKPPRETILCNYFEFGPVVQEMSFKDISNLELWRHFCSVEWNHLCNFIRGHWEEQF